MTSNIPEKSLRRQVHSTTKRGPFAQQIEHESTLHATQNSDSDDDLEVDLAKAALATGTTAFESQQWMEAESLLEEARRVLEVIPKERRTFCDIFDLHFKMSICTYYTQDHVTAEEALKSLSQHDITSDAHMERMCEATHLLSQLYIHMGRIDLAKEQCEKTLQVRRRLLGKRSDSSFESMALMAHIYVLLNNRALAKTYLAMVSEDRREVILKRLGMSLGMGMGHLDFSSIMYSQPAETSLPTTKAVHSGDPVPPEAKIHIAQSQRPLLATAAYSPAPSHSSTAPSESSPSFWQSSPRSVPGEQHLQPQPARWDTPPSSTAEPFEAASLHDSSMALAQPATKNSSGTDKITATELVVRDRRQRQIDAPAKPLPRKSILEKVGCQPRDNIEEAVCEGDLEGLVKLLDKKKGFWRGSLRKHVRPERVTALHFAALFGEVDMARRLIASNFNVNEIPFGYSTSLTPLHFALGARQLEMVRFLIANGARPVKPDTWSSLASQLMTRSWLLKTLSESERDGVAERITAILEILIDAGWRIDTPYGTAKNTVLHQAITFWTGSYKMDLELRAIVTRFLCSSGADPLLRNGEGITAWDLASREGHHDLLKILEEARRGANRRDVAPVELPGH